MKRIAVPLLATSLFFAGCVYETPLVEEHSIRIDSSVLGLWEPQPDEGKESDTGERMMILKFSDTEYLIHYPVRNDGLYYRGYPIKIGGISCVQLQVIGTQDGVPKKDNKDLFHVASYKLKKGILEIRTLNTDLVDRDLKSGAALQKAFLKNKDDKDLFTNPGKFRKRES